MEEKQKYELTDISMEYDGHTLYRIRALRDIPSPCFTLPGVMEGVLGGYVEGYSNLSQAGNCWVGENAVVMENACVAGNVSVYNNAVVRGNVEMFGDVIIRDDSVINGNKGSYIMGDVIICDYAHLSGKFCVSGKSILTGHTVVDGPDIILAGVVRLYGQASITGKVNIHGDMTLTGNARIIGPEKGMTYLYLGRAGEFTRGDVIRHEYDYYSFYNQWSSRRLVTYMTNTGMWTTGCFHGTRWQLVLKAFDDSFVKGLCFWRATRMVKELCWLRKLTVADYKTRLGRFKNWIFGEMN